MTVSRLVRANVLSLREQDFVLAARGIGAQPASLLPGISCPIRWRL